MKRAAIPLRLTISALRMDQEVVASPVESSCRAVADFAGCADGNRSKCLATSQNRGLKTGKVGTPFLK